MELAHSQLCARAFGEAEEIPWKLLRPKPDGYAKGVSIDFEKMPLVTNRYFELIGVDPVTRLPLRSELERLGLKDVADRLEELQPQEAPATPEETSPQESPEKRKRKR